MPDGKDDPVAVPGTPFRIEHGTVGWLRPVENNVLCYVPRCLLDMQVFADFKPPAAVPTLEEQREAARLAALVSQLVTLVATVCYVNFSCYRPAARAILYR
jgi:hypothetical protein